MSTPATRELRARQKLFTHLVDTGTPLIWAEAIAARAEYPIEGWLFKTPNAKEILKGAFLWNRSAEGGDFWAEIHATWGEEFPKPPAPSPELALYLANQRRGQRYEAWSLTATYRQSHLLALPPYPHTARAGL